MNSNVFFSFAYNVIQEKNDGTRSNKKNSDVDFYKNKITQSSLLSALRQNKHYFLEEKTLRCGSEMTQTYNKQEIFPDSKINPKK